MANVNRLEYPNVGFTEHKTYIHEYKRETERAYIHKNEKE